MKNDLILCDRNFEDTFIRPFTINFQFCIQPMNEEQEGGTFKLYFLGLTNPEEGVSTLISFADFYADLNGKFTYRLSSSTLHGFH